MNPTLTSHFRASALTLFLGTVLSLMAPAQNCTNLLINPGFENGLNGWSTTGDVTISTDAYTGTKAAEICGGPGSVSQIVVATPGETYTASVWGKLNGIPSSQTATLRFLNASYMPLPGAPISFGFPSENEYTQRSYAATAPPDAAYAHLLVYKENNGCVLVDEAEICVSGGECNISASVSNIECDDNGTPTDPTDDTFSIDLTVNSANAGVSTWDANVGGINLSGQYGETKTFGPIPIVGNVVSYNIIDVDIAGCLEGGTITVPPPCSNAGEPDLVITEVSCPDEYPGPGVDVTWDISVVNFGSGTSDATEIYLWNAVLAPLAKHSYGSVTIPVLTPGAARQVSITVPSSTYFPNPGDAGLGQNFIFSGSKYLSFDPQGDTQDYTEADGFPDPFCKKYSTDLQLELTPITTSLGTNEPVTFQMTVTNNGPVDAYNVESDFDFGYAALGFPVPNVSAVINDGEFWRQDFSGGGTQPYRFFWYLPLLEAGESVTAEVTIDPALFVGGVDYVINRTVSSGHNMDPDPSNNTDEIVIPFQTNPVLDFVLESFTASAFINGSFSTVNANDVITSGENIQFISHFATHNITETLPDFTITISGYLSTDPILDNGDLLLASGTRFMDEFAQSFPFTEGGFGQGQIPASTPNGDYFIIVKYDSEDIIAEADEANNILVLPVGVTDGAGPDLIITDVSCPTDFPKPDQAITWEVEVKNEGSAASQPTALYLYSYAPGPMGNESTEYGNELVPALTPGASTTVTFTVPPSVHSPNPDFAGYGEAILLTGMRGLSFSPISAGGTPAYIEADGFPNIYCKKFSTDIEVNLTTAMTEVAPDEPVVFTMTVTNNGPEDAHNILSLMHSYNTSQPFPLGHSADLETGNIWEIAQATGGGTNTFLEYWHIPFLAVGQSASAIVTMTPIFNEWTGPFAAFLRGADSAHNTDTDPSNNSDNFLLPVSDGLIDLELNLAQPNLDPAQWSSYPVTATLTNNGDATATGVKVSFAKPAGVVYTGGNEFTASQGSFNPNGNEVWTVGSLPPGESATLEVSYFLLASESPVAWAEVSEANETDMDSTPGNGVSPSVNEDDEASTDSAPTGLTIVCPADLTTEAFPPFPNVPLSGIDPLQFPTATTDCGAGNASVSFDGFEVIIGNIEVLSPGGMLGQYAISGFGTIKLLFVATDPCGNTEYCDYTLTRVPLIPAVEYTNCPDVIEVNVPAGTTESTVDLPTLAAIEFCPNNDGPVLNPIVQVLGPPSGSSFPLGSTEVGFQVLSCYGLQANCFYNVIVSEEDPIDQPDLTLANLGIQNSPIEPGQILTYEFDISNIGTAAASGNFNVLAWISTDQTISPDDIQDGIVPTGNYAAGLTQTDIPGASTIPNGLADGQYYLILKVDADDDISESNEGNNLVFAPFTIGSGGGDIDLSLAMSADPIDPPIYSNTELTLLITNAGPQTATGVVVEFKRPSGTVYTGGSEYTATQGIFNPFGPETWEVGSIPAGGTATLTVSYFMLTANALAPYAQVIAANETDVDSTPANGTPPNPNEDDEASFTLNAFAGGGGVALQTRELIGRPVQLRAVNPNPVYHGKINVVIDSREDGRFDLECYDLFGRLAFLQKIELEERRNEIPLDVSDLRSGTYYLNMPGENWRGMPIRFVVARW